MSKIFFISQTVNPRLSLDCGYHLWTPSGANFSYGVVLLDRGHNDPHAVVAQLQAAGMLVVPGTHDPVTPVGTQIATILASYNVQATDLGRHCATKMGTAHGATLFKPNLF